MEYQRNLTREYINRDPTVVVLTSRSEQARPGGGKEWVDGAVRAPQTFKLISQNTAVSQGSGSASGQPRKYDYVMLGLYDAAVELKDWFQASDGQRYEVVGKMPHNGYEVRVFIASYGPNPMEG